MLTRTGNRFERLIRGCAAANSKTRTQLPLVKCANIAIVILVFRGRSAGDEVQETWEYRTDRQQRGTWHDAVRWQDEYGQPGSGGHNAHGEASPGRGNQLHRYSGRVQPRGKRDSVG